MGSTTAIVVAAGGGTQFGAQKQFADLDGVRLVDWAVAVADAACDDVIVVVPAGHAWHGAPVHAAVPGARRAPSRCAPALPPCLPGATSSSCTTPPDRSRGRSLFVAVIAAVRDGADAAVPAVPLPDTVKRVDGTRVVETVPRDTLVAVQTPQAFRADALRAAHTGHGDATDDAALVEATGATVVIVPGDPGNLKVTTTADLTVAAALLTADD